MLSLSNDAVELCATLTESKVIRLAESRLVLYYETEDCAKLRSLGWMNIVLWDHDPILGLSIDELENAGVIIKFQEKMLQLNSSDIVGMWEADNVIYLQHWEGFCTTLDPVTFKVIAQEFTK